MKTNLHQKQQLEIGFTHESFAVTARHQTRRTRRLTRARWWFRRMHEVVNQAFDWSPAPAARPEQIYLTLTQG